MLFGQNHWLAQGDENRTGYLHLLWPKVKESGVQLIRIGGNHYEVEPPSWARWTAMVDSVQAIGVEPLLQVPRQFTAEQATRLVKHFNRPGRRPIRYWSIGNEPMLHDKTSLEEVHAYHLRIATALRAADPTIKIFAFDEAYLREDAYAALCGGALDLTGKDAAGRWLIDGFNYRSYPNGESFGRADVTVTGVEKIRAQTKALVALIERANQKHGRVGEARLRWGLTELNVTYANPDRNVEGYGNPSFLGGQFIAEIFGIGMEYGAWTVAPWSLNETDAVKTDFGYLGLPPDFPPRSSYYHEQMLARSFTGSYMVTKSNQPLVKVIGAKTKAGFAVMVLNQETEREFGFDAVLNAQGSSTKDLVIQADAALKTVTAGTIAPQTTQVLEYNRSGKLISKTTYGVIDNLRNLPPKVEVIR